MGYWRLSRTATDAEAGPGLLPPLGAPVARTADDVELLRNAEGGFDIEVSIVHADGVSELYLGAIHGPRIDVATDAVVRTAGAKVYAAATRMYGLVDGHLLWAWDIAALGRELVVARLGTPCAGRLMPGPFARVPGAVIDETGLRHLGNPLGEQRALASGRAVAPLGDRTVLAVPGEDRLSWLDSLTSQALTRLAPGESTELLVLDPHGHVEHAASVLDDGETTWLIVDRGDAEGLLSWLRKMRFRLRVDPRDASDEYAVIGGTRAALDGLTSAEPAGLPLVWVDPWPGVAPGGYAYAAVEPHPGAERDWAEAIVTRDEEERIADAAAAGDLALAGLVAADALRVAAWRPRWANEVDERALPHELDWLRTAVHLEKGCYRGQETVAKVHNLGHPPRRVVALQLDGSDSVLPVARRRGVRSARTPSASSPRRRSTSKRARSRSRSCAGTPPSTPRSWSDTEDGDLVAAQEVIVPPGGRGDRERPPPATASVDEPR